MRPEAEPRQGFFDAARFHSVLAALPAYLKPVARFGYLTGWRRSEITGLLWDRVDLKERSIRLLASEVKNKQPRYLPLDGELLAIVDSQRKAPVVSCYVFHRHGRRIRSFYKAWKTATKKAGCPGLLFHDFRRTAARNLTQGGLSEKQAMMITGHKTSAVFRRYNIVTESDLQRAVLNTGAFQAGAGKVGTSDNSCYSEKTANR
jgi:integrase